jgi:hypothetical protein
MQRSGKAWPGVAMGMAAGLAVAAVAVLWVTHTDDAGRPARSPVPIEVVGERADGHTVLVHLRYSSCQEFDRIDVAEDARTVRLTAYVRDVPWCGTVPETSQVVPAWLGGPLAGRTVVDGRTGGAIRTG